MTSYVCYNCRSVVEVEKVVGDIFCKNCSCKILFKHNPELLKKVSCD